MKKQAEEYTYRDLDVIESTDERTTEKPQALPLAEILVAPQVFQPRMMLGNYGEDISYVPLLADELKRNAGRPLDPIQVVAIGGHFYCVDGHHRLEAYQQYGWSEQVPVEVFEGKLVDAFVQSWQRNSKPKLNTTANDRTEWAWRLVQLERHSKREQVAITGCADGTIARMRRILRERGAEVRGQCWYRVQRMMRPECDLNVQDWQEEQAEKLAVSIVKHTNLKVALNPEILARAIYTIDEDLPAHLIREWQDEVQPDELELLDI